jgi:hypothetical protein
MRRPAIPAVGARESLRRGRTKEMGEEEDCACVERSDWREIGQEVSWGERSAMASTRMSCGACATIASPTVLRTSRRCRTISIPVTSRG